MAVLGQDLFMVRGEDLNLDFALAHGAIDIRSWSIRWELRQSVFAVLPVVEKDVQSGGITFLDGKHGTLRIRLYKEDTQFLTLQNEPWYWELRRYDPGASTTLA